MSRLSPPAAPPQSHRADVFVGGRLTNLTYALDTIPRLRPEAVALGRQLAADPNYPGPVVLEQLAALFVTDAQT